MSKKWDETFSAAGVARGLVEIMHHPRNSVVLDPEEEGKPVEGACFVMLATPGAIGSCGLWLRHLLDRFSDVLEESAMEMHAAAIDTHPPPSAEVVAQQYFDDLDESIQKALIVMLRDKKA